LKSSKPATGQDSDPFSSIFNLITSPPNVYHNIMLPDLTTQCYMPKHGTVRHHRHGNLGSYTILKTSELYRSRATIPFSSKAQLYGVRYRTFKDKDQNLREY
jgi:hypothetical protein